MAKPIVKTPDLTGEDAKRFLKMHTDTTLTNEKRELFKDFVSVYRKHK